MPTTPEFGTFEFVVILEPRYDRFLVFGEHLRGMKSETFRAHIPFTIQISLQEAQELPPGGLIVWALLIRADRNSSGCSGGSCSPLNSVESELIASEALHVSASEAREASGSSDAMSRSNSGGKARRDESFLLPNTETRSRHLLDHNLLVSAGGTGRLTKGVD